MIELVNNKNIDLAEVRNLGKRKQDDINNESDEYNNKDDEINQVTAIRRPKKWNKACDLQLQKVKDNLNRQS
ncbi:5125_t:CDS:2 [Racocetra fulgida]|uniref:5125_t:CDS:1 n=1 Tax=Racocetra fulgida TaxID=60492 RepID=A0A9N9A3B0_9GLOM|nr:5125_t:CDS:2 [Racocetra fulgida]